MSFGQIIAEARKSAGLSQKDLAARIKKEDGGPISAQYLNDIEHDRRNAPPEFLLKKFASELNLSFEYLLFLAGEYPDDLKKEKAAHKPEEVEAAFRAFRKVLKGR